MRPRPSFGERNIDNRVSSQRASERYWAQVRKTEEERKKTQERLYASREREFYAYKISKIALDGAGQDKDIRSEEYGS